MAPDKPRKISPKKKKKNNKNQNETLCINLINFVNYPYIRIQFLY